MVNGVITSDGMVDGQRLVSIERDSIWQSLFAKLSFSAMLAVGISYIAITAIILFQMADLNIQMADLNSKVESNSVTLERLTDTVDEMKVDVAGLKTDVAGLKIDMVKVKAHLNID